MKLSDLYKTLTKAERESLSKAINTSPGYLYQLATQWRDKKPSLEILKALSQADSRLTIEDLVNEFTGTSAISNSTQQGA